VASYDWLVLATGSRPFVPPMRGADVPGVFVYRTIEDIHAIRARAHGAKSAAVIGGGLLGLEAAQALLNLGLAATVVERGPGLMARQLSPASAELLRRKVEELGVRVLLKRETLEARPHESGGLSIAFRDYEPLD
jgi:nitrite reductase (NADH) large subunit